MKATSWIFRRLTQNEFKAITDQIQSEGGGSQTYIDLPKGKISDADLNEFFGEGMSLGANKGLKWEIPIHSLSLDLPPQQTIISLRRDSSNCIREQNKEKRINIWKEENSGFPSDKYNETENPIYIFILKTEEDKYYAGWFYAKQYNETWYLTKELCQPIVGKDTGYCKFNIPIEFSTSCYSWPFIGLSPEDTNRINDNRLNNSLLKVLSSGVSEEVSNEVVKLQRAIRTKPFVLLAGISGTGKSRIVRQLAKACWPEGSAEATAQKPSNFEMVQVKPNWHDSSELLGYVSRIGKDPKFIAGDFLKFIAKAWEDTDTPYFLCLDEMNLAPVEQYFAEYLSVVESRKLQDDGKTILSDPILKKEDEQWYYDLANSLTSDEGLRNQFLKDGIAIPQNLIVIGTVNMDETTYSFSRKVLDRAMTIEMNEVNLNGGLHKADANIKPIPVDHFLADAVEGYDVYEQYEEACNIVIDYLGKVNAILDKTPFKVAYRTRNEFLIYVVNALRLAHKEDADKATIAQALDEVTSMKILSRIEGDKRKVHFLDKLEETIKNGLDGISEVNDSVSLAKLETMAERLKSGYTSFWD